MSNVLTLTKARNGFILDAHGDKASAMLESSNYPRIYRSIDALIEHIRAWADGSPPKS